MSFNYEKCNSFQQGKLTFKLGISNISLNNCCLYVFISCCKCTSRKSSVINLIYCEKQVFSYNTHHSKWEHFGHLCYVLVPSILCMVFITVCSCNLSPSPNKFNIGRYLKQLLDVQTKAIPRHRVTRLPDFLPIGLLLDAQFDFL